MDLQDQKNDAYESRPGYFQPCHWCVWIVLECGFMSSYKMDFSSCGIMLGFGKSINLIKILCESCIEWCLSTQLHN